MPTYLVPVVTSIIALISGAAGALSVDLLADYRQSAPSAQYAVPVDITPVDVGAIQRLERAPDGLFYLTARVNGAPVRFVVDTGASVTVLSRNDAARLGLNSRAGRRGQIRTANGSTSMQMASINSMAIGRNQLRHVEVAVIDAPLQVSLLGQNALRQLGRLSINGDKLEIS